MREGDEVVCIDNSINKRSGHIPKLTFGKMYIIDYIEYDSFYDMTMISVYNDEDDLYTYNDYRFIDLATYDRRMKLNKLNNISDEGR